MKICTACGESKPSNEFYTNKKLPSGLSGHCKECIREYQLKYRADNIEKCRKQKRCWGRKNKDRRKEYDRQYRASGRKAEIVKRFKKRNPDKIRTYRLKRQNNLKKNRVQLSEKCCVECGELRTISNFHKVKNKADGYRDRCKLCDAKHHLSWQDQKKCSRCGKIKRAIEFRPVAINLDGRKDKCKSCMDILFKRNNPEKYKAMLQLRRKRSREKDRKRKQTTLRKMVDGRISHGMRDSLKDGKGNRSWRNLVPYTLDQLIRRLKRTMPAGYTWDDFLAGELHIDHIIPRSAFNYSSPDDLNFQRAWALSNLQLLPVKKNLKKGARIDGSFQPLFSFI